MYLYITTACRARSISAQNRMHGKCFIFYNWPLVRLYRCSLIWHGWKGHPRFHANSQIFRFGSLLKLPKLKRQTSVLINPAVSACPWCCPHLFVSVSVHAGHVTWFAVYWCTDGSCLSPWTRGCERACVCVCVWVGGCVGGRVVVFQFTVSPQTWYNSNQFLTSLVFFRSVESGLLCCSLDSLRKLFQNKTNSKIN